MQGISALPRWLTISTMGAPLAGLRNVAAAADLDMLSTGVVEPGLNAAAAALDTPTGSVPTVTVIVTSYTAPKLKKRRDGRSALAVLGPPLVVGEFAAASKLPDACANVDRIGIGIGIDIGVAVRAGAPVKQQVIWGKSDEIGFGAMTEILLYGGKGLTLVGLTPAELQNYTPHSSYSAYSVQTAALLASGKQQAPARTCRSFFTRAHWHTAVCCGRRDGLGWR